MARFSYHPCLPFAIACGLFFTSVAGTAAADDLAARRKSGDRLHGIYPDKEHAVVKGDTLWDLSASYLNDPFIWPDIWQVNPQIGHPDLIYPGNRVNLPGYSKTAQAPTPRTVAPGAAGAAPADAAAETMAASMAEAAPAPNVVIPSTTAGRTGWIIDEGDEVGLGTILGNWHRGRNLLATDAAVHVSLGARDGVVAGDRFRIINTDRVIHHPQTGKVVGRLARVVGEVEIVAVRDASATGRVTRANHPIQVGDAILATLEIPPITEPVEPREARDLSATILAAYDNQFALAEHDVIFLDVGERQSVQPGDRFLLHGTAATEIDGAPHYVAEAVVIAAQPSTCSAMIMRSFTETFVGETATFTTAALPDIYHQ
jgi:hypothetical protein